jgi:hypothetical protein
MATGSPKITHSNVADKIVTTSLRFAQAASSSVRRRWLITSVTPARMVTP